MVPPVNQLIVSVTTTPVFSKNWKVTEVRVGSTCKSVDCHTHTHTHTHRHTHTHTHTQTPHTHTHTHTHTPHTHTHAHTQWQAMHSCVRCMSKCVIIVVDVFFFAQESHPDRGDTQRAIVVYRDIAVSVLLSCPPRLFL